MCLHENNSFITFHPHAQMSNTRQLRSGKTVTIRNILRPTISRRKNHVFKNVQTLTPQQIEEASSIDTTGIPASILEKMESCQVRLTRYTSKELEPLNVETADVTDDVEINIKVSKDQLSPTVHTSCDKKSERNNESIGMKVEIFSTNSVLANTIISDIVISKLEFTANEVTETNSSPKIVRRSARNKEIKATASEKPNLIIKPVIDKQVIPVVTPLQRANSIWIQLISQSYELSLGTIICAKMKTFWPWPAQITRFQNTKVKVKFFGDLREGCVERKSCIPFNKCAFLVKSYIESIPLNSRNEYLKLLHTEYNEKDRPKFLKSLNIRGLYMQAIEDVGLYLEIKKSILREYMSEIR